MFVRSLEDMVGKTFVSVDIGEGESFFTFHTANGEKYRFIHHQDCCESVDLIDFDNSDLQLLLGSPILLAEERSNGDTEERPEGWYEDDAEKWTFYCLATNKGHVDFRFFGSSNGYYGIDVDVEKWDPDFVYTYNGRKGRWVEIPKPKTYDYNPAQQGDTDQDI